MDVSEAIRLKRAVRKFQDKPLPADVVRDILNAGRRAQSSKNTQMWRLIAVQDKTALRELSACGEWAKHLAGAALGVALLTPDPAEKFQYLFDAGQCAAYMQLAAWELGVGSCPASIYQPEKARAILGFPAEWHLRVALSFGYPLDEAKLSAPPKAGGRAAFDEIIRWDKWQ
ncbi:MAG: nitroreductase family protein [Anaerolineales bacterium]|nr:nitroreductase family protein [Anaerolineales bacterium]